MSDCSQNPTDSNCNCDGGNHLRVLVPRHYYAYNNPGIDVYSCCTAAKMESNAKFALLCENEGIVTPTEVTAVRDYVNGLPGVNSAANANNNSKIWCQAAGNRPFRLSTTMPNTLYNQTKDVCVGGSGSVPQDLQSLVTAAGGSVQMNPFDCTSNACWKSDGTIVSSTNDSSVAACWDTADLSTRLSCCQGKACEHTPTPNTETTTSSGTGSGTGSGTSSATGSATGSGTGSVSTETTAATPVWVWVLVAVGILLVVTGLGVGLYFALRKKP